MNYTLDLETIATENEIIIFDTSAMSSITIEPKYFNDPLKAAHYYNQQKEFLKYLRRGIQESNIYTTRSVAVMELLNGAPNYKEIINGGKRKKSQDVSKKFIEMLKSAEECNRERERVSDAFIRYRQIIELDEVQQEIFKKLEKRYGHYKDISAIMRILDIDEEEAKKFALTKEDFEIMGDGIAMAVTTGQNVAVITNDKNLAKTGIEILNREEVPYSKGPITFFEHPFPFRFQEFPYPHNSLLE